jgi:nucleoid-associated protein YgaU
MRRARILLILLLIAGGALAYFGYRNGWELASVPEAGAPVANAPEAKRVQEAKRAEEAKLGRPTFDVVRADPTGDLVMAGRAEPGWSVTVESNGQVLGGAVADAQGEWVITPSNPVRKGEHSLELKSQSPNGRQMLFSKQRLALSIGDANKGRPLVALTEEGAPTRVLQSSPPAGDDSRGASMASNDASAGRGLANPPLKPTPIPAAEAAAQVTFTSIDYEPNSGNAIFIAGRGMPGARVMLYIDNEFAGTATVDATGGWTFRGTRELKGTAHALRADHVELATGKVLARAEVNFDREAPKALALGATVPGLPGQSGLASGAPQPRAPAKAETGDATSSNPVVNAANAETAPEQAGFDPGVIIVRRGDTLWQIAQRHYGDGSKYTQIFQTNKGQIRNPNLIYPSQRFNVPQ